MFFLCMPAEAQCACWTWCMLQTEAQCACCTFFKCIVKSEYTVQAVKALIPPPPPKHAEDVHCTRFSIIYSVFFSLSPFNSVSCNSWRPVLFHRVALWPCHHHNVYVKCWTRSWSPPPPFSNQTEAMSFSYFIWWARSTKIFCKLECNLFQKWFWPSIMQLPVWNNLHFID